MPPQLKSLDPEMRRWAVALGAALRKRRRVVGVTAHELHELTQIGPSKVLAVERGEGNVTLRTLVRLCAGLGCTPPELFAAARRELSR